MGKRINNPSFDKYIREHFPKDLISDIAKALGKSPAWVFQRAEYLGIKHTDAYYINLLHCRREKSLKKIEIRKQYENENDRI